MIEEKTEYGESDGTAHPFKLTLRQDNNNPISLLHWALIALVYFVSAKFGLMLAFEQANTSPVWPPTGIAIAALLYFGLRAWPAIFIAAFAANYLTGVSIAVAASIAVGNTIEGLLAGYLILKFADRVPFGSIVNVIRFVAIVSLAAAISALIGVSSLALGGYAGQADTALLWSTWWLGDIVGALVVAPLLLTWFPFSRSSWLTDKPLEAVGLVCAGMFCSALVFSDWLVVDANNSPLAFIFLPFAIWAAVRFRQQGVTAVVFILSIFAIYGTLQGFGPFVRPSENESLLLLQGFMGIMVITALTLAASHDEKRKTERALLRERQTLKQNVEQRNEELIQSNEALEKEVENRQRATEALGSLLASSAYAGERLYYTCLEDLATIFDAKFAFISVFADDTQTTMRTLAFWSEGKVVENLEYPLEGTICKDVMNEKVKLVTESAAQQYPTAEAMQTLAVDSFYGAALISPAQTPFGVVIVMDTEPMSPQLISNPILGLTASRIALEIERNLAEDELKLSASVFNESIEAIVITDRDGAVLRVNPAFTRITGFGGEEVIGENPRLWGSKRHDKAFFEEMWDTLLNDGFWQGELWDRRKSGEIFPTWQTISAVRNTAADIIQFISIFSDISDKKRSEERIHHLAHYDLITGLPNRAFFQEQLEHSLAHARRQRSSLALLFLDLDNFKVINDAFGHPTGDALLDQVAQRLAEIVREEDTVARLGGDEFTILLTDIRDNQDAALVAEKILTSFAQPFKNEGIEMVVSASIGISVYPADGDDGLSLLKNADSAMYQAKQNGRNNFQFFTAEMNVLAQERLSLEADLRRALERDEFMLHFQPQLCLSSGEILGCEALVRWQHPDKGWISPYTFIPVAEESGLIIPLSEWVMRTALEQLKQWQAKGFNTLNMSVNLSAQQFGRQNLVQTVQRLLDETGIDARHLELELTESMLMANVDATIDTLHALRDMGVRLSIDDFGTGYSSMAYLKRFPIDKLKIDQSFVRELTVDSEDAAIVTATIALGHSLNLTVIAEGVETEAQFEFLRAKACEQIQGYYFSRPLPADEFIDLLQDGQNIMRNA